VSRADDALVIHLHDQATPFDPTEVPPPDLTVPLEQRPVGGMGIYLMQQLMDEVSYRTTPQGGNWLTMRKRGMFDLRASAA
jgi:serine/threonine-protein kinase RsbW